MAPYTKKYLLLCLLSISFAFGQYVSIPDDNFENALNLYDDIDGDNKIPEKNIVDLEVLNVAGYRIESLEGIQYFKSLKELNCSSNQLTMLNLSNQPSLQTLRCESNKIQTLDLSNNPQLEYLFCSNNNIEEIDLLQSTRLKYLYCQNNQLSTLDIRRAKNLQHLYCQNNQISNLSVTRNIRLKKLHCEGNNLEFLNIANGHVKSLETFYYFRNNLTKIYTNKSSFVDISEKYGLDWRGDEGVSFLDIKVLEVAIPDWRFEKALVDNAVDDVVDGKALISDLETIRELDISGHGIADLTGIQYFKSLRWLDCSNNQLTRLDLSDNLRLSYADCSSNKLADLILKNNQDLEVLKCNDNDLSYIDVYQCERLNDFNCSYNHLIDLDMTKNPELQYLDCSENKLKRLDLDDNNRIKKLKISGNEDNLEVNLKGSEVEF